MSGRPLAALVAALLVTMAVVWLGTRPGTVDRACAGDPFSRDCNLVFIETTNAVFLGGLAHLVFRVDYPTDKLDFGTDPVACELHPKQQGVTATITNDPVVGFLRADLSRANGLFPDPLVVCTPRGTDAAQSATLNVTVIESRDRNGDLLDPPAVVEVDSESFFCTTVTVPTSSTLPATTTTTTPGETTTTLETTTTVPETTTTTIPPAICGDADDNGVINAADALVALRTAVGLAECPLERCDIDHNGALNAADSLHILRKSVGLPENLVCV